MFYLKDYIEFLPFFLAKITNNIKSLSHASTKYKVSSISSAQTKSTSFFKKTKAYFSKFAFAMTLRSPEMSHHYCLVSDILSFFPLFSHHNQIFPLNGIQLLFSHYSLVLNFSASFWLYTISNNLDFQIFLNAMKN